MMERQINLWKNLDLYAQNRAMKWVWSTIGIMTFTIVSKIIGLGDMADSIEGWQKMLSWVPGGGWSQASEMMPFVLAWTYVLSVMVSGLLSVWLLVGFAVYAAAHGRIVWIVIKKGMGMLEWLSEAEAHQVIKRSDFYLVRSKLTQPNALLVFTGAAELMRALGTPEKRAREEIIDRNLVKKILESFTEKHPDDTKAGKYSAEALEAYLQRLIDKEVENEVGSIPDV